MDWARRLLNVASEPMRTDQATKVRAFASILMIHLAARAWVAGFKADSIDTRYIVAASVLTLLMFAVFVGRWARPALIMATIVQLAIIAKTFPEVANHRYLETFCIAALASFDLSKSEERTTLLELLRWALVIVFFHTGVQKVLYGMYFDGQFLGYEIAASGRFALFFQGFLPAEEFERLRSLAPRRPGEGPFAVQSTLFLMMANGVWIFEMIAPAFMLWKRTRVWAAVLAISFTLSLQCGAREFMFALLFTNMALLFVPKAVNRWFIVPLSLIYLYFILLATGLVAWAPQMVFN